MTTKAEWLALSERCEKATGSDREIDAAMHDAVNGGSDAWEAFRKWGGGVQWIEPYTRSLDAIVALIGRGELPAAWVWTLGQNIHHRTWGVSINNLDSDGVPYSVCWGASSHAPALALCAAFCRAMSEKAE